MSVLAGVSGLHPPSLPPSPVRCTVSTLFCEQWLVKGCTGLIWLWLENKKGILSKHWLDLVISCTNNSRPTPTKRDEKNNGAMQGWCQGFV